MLENMNHQMQQIWTEFRQSTSDSGFDYLSLRHLGLVLKFLSAKGILTKPHDNIECMLTDVVMGEWDKIVGMGCQNKSLNKSRVRDQNGVPQARYIVEKPLK